MNQYGYIYIHKNKVNGHVYIGQSTQDFERRCRKSDKSYNAYKTCPAMYAALIKYGWEGFDSDILIWVDSQEELNRLEEKYIEQYKSADGTHGYNTVKFSEGRGKQAESTKEKISQKQIKFNESLKKLGIVKIAPNRKEHKIINGIEYKHCVGNDKQSHWTPITEFGSYKRTWDHLHNKCRKCHNDYVRESKTGSKKLLSSQELKQSYIDRSEAMSKGIKRKFSEDPEYRIKMSEVQKKAIIRIDPNTGDTKEYDSGLAAKADGFDNTYVSQACKTGKIFKGFRWMKKETGPKDPVSN